MVHIRINNYAAIVPKRLSGQFQVISRRYQKSANFPPFKNLYRHSWGNFSSNCYYLVIAGILDFNSNFKKFNFLF